MKVWLPLSELISPTQMTASLALCGSESPTLIPLASSRTAKHLFVSLGSSGLPAEMLQLPTAGSKFLALHAQEQDHWWRFIG